MILYHHHIKGDGLAPLAVNGTREHRGRGGTVSGDVVRLRCDRFDELGAHILEIILEVDGLGDGYAILGDFRRTVRLSDDYIPSLGTKCYLFCCCCCCCCC